MKNRAQLDALKASLMATTKECAYAQFMLGIMLLEEPREPGDVEEAVDWFTKAADTGYTDAHLQLGMMYQDGIGVRKDPSQAMKWFRKPAEEGNPWAQFSMGELSGEVEGSGDAFAALEWFRKAAAQGYAEAREMLDKYGKNP